MTAPLPSPQGNSELFSSHKLYQSRRINTLVLLYDPIAGHVFMGKHHWGIAKGKWNFPGGKYNPAVDKDIRACAIRELREESNLEPLEPEDVVRRAVLRYTYQGNQTHISREIETHLFVVHHNRIVGHPDISYNMELQHMIMWPADMVYYDKMWADTKVWLPHLFDDLQREHKKGWHRSSPDPECSWGHWFLFNATYAWVSEAEDTPDTLLHFTLKYYPTKYLDGKQRLPYIGATDVPMLSELPSSIQQNPAAMQTVLEPTDRKVTRHWAVDSHSRNPEDSQLSLRKRALREFEDEQIFEEEEERIQGIRFDHGAANSMPKLAEHWDEERVVRALTPRNLQDNDEGNLDALMRRYEEEITKIKTASHADLIALIKAVTTDEKEMRDNLQDDMWILSGMDDKAEKGEREVLTDADNKIVKQYSDKVLELLQEEEADNGGMLDRLLREDLTDYLRKRLYDQVTAKLLEPNAPKKSEDEEQIIDAERESSHDTSVWHCASPTLQPHSDEVNNAHQHAKAHDLHAPTSQLFFAKEAHERKVHKMHAAPNHSSGLNALVFVFIPFAVTVLTIQQFRAKKIILF